MLSFSSASASGSWKKITSIFLGCLTIFGRSKKNRDPKNCKIIDLGPRAWDVESSIRTLFVGLAFGRILNLWVRESPQIDGIFFGIATVLLLPHCGGNGPGIFPPLSSWPLPWKERTRRWEKRHCHYLAEWAKVSFITFKRWRGQYFLGFHEFAYFAALHRDTLESNTPTVAGLLCWLMILRCQPVSKLRRPKNIPPWSAKKKVNMFSKILGNHPIFPLFLFSPSFLTFLFPFLNQKNLRSPLETPPKAASKTQRQAESSCSVSRLKPGESVRWRRVEQKN